MLSVDRFKLAIKYTKMPAIVLAHFAADGYLTKYCHCSIRHTLPCNINGLRHALF